MHSFPSGRHPEEHHCAPQPSHGSGCSEQGAGSQLNTQVSSEPPLHGRFVQTKLSMVNFGIQLPLVVCEVFCSLIVSVLPLELVQKCQWAQRAVSTCRAWASAPSSSSKVKFHT